MTQTLLPVEHYRSRHFAANPVLWAVVGEGDVIPEAGPVIGYEIRYQRRDGVWCIERLPDEASARARAERIAEHGPRRPRS